MRSDDMRAKLIAEFPGLANASILLPKEVFAHFGLAFMAFGLVEHSLINSLTLNIAADGVAAGQIRNRAEWEAAFDKAQAAALSLTFGNLVKRVSVISEFADLDTAFGDAKRLRDYLAHHLMREEAKLFDSDSGGWLLLSKISNVRKQIESLDALLKLRFDAMRVRLKINIPTKQYIEEQVSQYLEEAADALTQGSAKVGWEK